MREKYPCESSAELTSKYGEMKSVISVDRFRARNSQCKAPEEWNKNRASEAREW